MTSEVLTSTDYDASMREGSILHRAGKPEFALIEFEKALGTSPQDPNALANALAACGTVLSELERKQAAYSLLASRRELLAGDADGLTNLGIAAEACDEVADATACYESALRIAPLHPRALVKLCWLHARTGDFDGAIFLARSLVDDRPGDLGRTLLLADVLLSASRFDEACESLKSVPAISSIPEAAHAHLLARLVLSHALAGNLDAARGALAESPQLVAQAVAAIALIPGLPSAIARFVKLIEPNAAADIDSLLILCASQSISAGYWRSETALAAFLREIIANVASNYSLKLGWRELRRISMMLPLADDERVRFLALSQEQADARVIAQKPLARNWFPEIGESRVRLGIAVGNIDDPHHSAKISKLLRLHDRKRFRLNLYCVTERPAPSFYTSFEALADQVIEIAHLSAGEAVARIRLDRLDLMIDMTGHEASVLDAALWARVAKVQAGLPSWSENLRGTPYDVFLEDTVTQATFATAESAIDKETLRKSFGKAIGIPQSAFVMTSLPAPFMLDQATFAAWMDILRAAESAVLLLPFYSPAIHAYWQVCAVGHGIDKSRIVFSRELARAQDMSSLGVADLYLDTLRINSSEGLSDALMAGVPAICMSGDSRASQMSARVLAGEGLPELVLANRDAYVAAAVRLATDPESIAAFKDAIHRTMTGPRAIRSMTRMIEWENSLIAAANPGTPGDAIT